MSADFFLPSSLFDVQSASSSFLPFFAAPVALPNHFTRNEITEADDGRSGFEIFGEISKLRWAKAWLVIADVHVLAGVFKIQFDGATFFRSPTQVVEFT